MLFQPSLLSSTHLKTFLPFSYANFSSSPHPLCSIAALHSILGSHIPPYSRTIPTSFFPTHLKNPTNPLPSGGATDTTGYLATDTTNKIIVLSFRGSESVRNYLTDADFPLTTIDICTGCQGESGFWDAWSENRATILPSVTATVASYPSYKVVVTGHSLGGAIATFAAAELRNGGISVDLVSFSQSSARTTL